MLQVIVTKIGEKHRKKCSKECENFFFILVSFGIFIQVPYVQKDHFRNRILSVQSFYLLLDLNLFQNVAIILLFLTIDSNFLVLNKVLQIKNGKVQM